MFEQGKPPYSIDTTAPRTSIETTFFGKVMFFFALAILTSTIGVYIGGKYLLQYFISQPFLMWGLFAAELGLIFTSRRWSQKVPLNRILFLTFALISGITIAPLVSIVLAAPTGAAILTKALLATGFTFTAAALIGHTTKYDLTGLRGFLTVGIIGLIVVGILGFIFPWGNTMELVYSGFGILLFTGFTMYNVQQLKSYPQDRYIDAALSLYLDIFNLFILILRFMLAFAGRD